MVGEIRLGTSSFTADGWNGSFYPKGMKSADYLGYYSRRFDTVEVDSTFYHCPAIEPSTIGRLRLRPASSFRSRFLAPSHTRKSSSSVTKSLRNLLARRMRWARNWGRSFFSFPFSMTRSSQVMCSSSRDFKPSSRSCRAWAAAGLLLRSETNTG